MVASGRVWRNDLRRVERRVEKDDVCRVRGVLVEGMGLS